MTPTHADGWPTLGPMGSRLRIKNLAKKKGLTPKEKRNIILSTQEKTDFPKLSTTRKKRKFKEHLLCIPNMIDENSPL